MSIIRADSIKNRSGAGAPDFPNGITVTGVVTATVLDVSVPHLKVGDNIQLGAAGIATATSGIFGDFVDVGSNIKLGNAGVITATKSNRNYSDCCTTKYNISWNSFFT